MTAASVPSQFVPTWTGDVELSGGWPTTLTDPGGARSRCHLLVRLHGEPIGFVDAPLDAGVLAGAEFRDRVESGLDQELRDHLARDGIDQVAAGRPSSAWACQRSGPFPVPVGPVSVVLCTRDRGPLLTIALASVLANPQPDLDVVVVDNAPQTDEARRVVADLSDPRVRYVLEPRPGLSVARNTGLREARGNVIAFTDDDVRVDPGWIAGLVRGFTRAPGVGCVTGLVASDELDTPPQHFFEHYVHWGEACRARVFTLPDRPEGWPLYPYTAGGFGTGASFAISRAAQQRLGFFDEALGAGAPTRGGEDLDWFVRTLLGGFALAYEPAALVWHRHRPDDAALGEQLYGYGTGLTAYLTKHALTPRGAASLLKGSVRLLLMLHSTRRESIEHGIDPAMLRRQRVGMLHGPLLYARARRRTR